MEKKKIYKTLITMVVLSDDPIDNMDIKDIIEECDYGSCLLGNITMNKKVIEGKEAVNEIYKAGSEPGFFFMDENGFENNDDYFSEKDNDN